jgi:hypothetical protein
MIEAMRIDMSAGGKVGIGTTDIDAVLDIVNSVEYIRIAQSVSDDTTKTGGLAVRHRDNEEEDFHVISGVSGSTKNIVNIGGSDFIGSLNAATDIAFHTAANRTTVDGTERMRIDSSGNIGVGLTSPTFSSGNGIHLADSFFMGFGNGANSRPDFQIGFGGTNLDIRCGNGADTADISIDPNGKVGIGESSPSADLTVTQSGSTFSTASNTVGLFQRNSTTGHACGLTILAGNAASSILKFGDADDEDVAVIQYEHDVNNMVFKTDANERFRISNSNHVLFYTTSTSAPDGNGGVIVADDGNGSFIQISKKTTSAVPAMEFYNSNGRVGQIIPQSSSTSFTTSSDYRLKENVTTSWDATARLKQLKPSRFNFKSDKDTTLDGFLAHEVASIVPEAITGEKDAVDKDGNIQPQGIDQSKLVPLMVKTIQELEARIAVLEAK